MFAHVFSSGRSTTYDLERAACEKYHTIPAEVLTNGCLSHPRDTSMPRLQTGECPNVFTNHNMDVSNGTIGISKQGCCTTFRPVYLCSTSLCEAPVADSSPSTSCCHQSGANNPIPQPDVNTKPCPIEHIHSGSNDNSGHAFDFTEMPAATRACACNVESQSGCSSLRHCRSGFGSINYELSEDLRAKEIEMIERCYGGRLRAHRAARIIQSVYREYRLRAEYAKICLERCTHRNAVHTNRHHTVVAPVFLPPASSATSASDQSTLKPSESLEDLVLEQAYVDWALKAATEQVACSLVPHSDTKRCGSAERISNDSGFTPSSSERIVESSNTSSASLQSEGFTTSHSNGVNKTINCSLSDNTCNVFVSPSFSGFAHPNSHGILGASSPHADTDFASYGQFPIMSYEHGSHGSPSRKISSPVLSRKATKQGDHSHICLSSIPTVPHTKRGFSVDPEPNFNQRLPIPVCDAYTVRQLESGCTAPPGRIGCCNCSKTSRSLTSQLSNGLLLAQPNSACSNLVGNRHYVLTKPHPASDRVFARAASQGYTATSSSSSSATSAQLCPRSVFVAAVPPHQGLRHVRNSSHIAHRSIPITSEHGLFLANPRGHVPLVRQPGLGSTCFPVYNPLQFSASQQAKLHARQMEKRRKRVYRIGLNLFNKSSVKGIEFLIRCNFLDRSPESVARFLLTRKGLSRVAIGDYLGSLRDELAVATTKQFMRELDFREQEVDEALRALLSCFRTPGESQKIVHLLTEFQSAYIEQNAARVRTQFRNPDSVMVLAYAIVMLHTDIHSPNIRPRAKMTREEFVRNLRGIDDGEDLDRNLLLSIYSRIQSREMTVLPDHTDQVRKIQQHLTGPDRPINLALPHRRLVCYCRLYEVPDKTKKDRAGAHQREVFLFNDLLLLTKAVQKKRRDAAIAYQVRLSLNLLGLRLATFENQFYQHGLELILPFAESLTRDDSSASSTTRNRIIVALNTKTLSDRARFMEDLQECILEVTEMDRLRAEGELAKQGQPKSRHYSPSHTQEDLTAGREQNRPSNCDPHSQVPGIAQPSPRHTVSPITTTVDSKDMSFATRTLSSCPTGLCSKGVHRCTHCGPGGDRSLSTRNKSTGTVTDGQRSSGDSGLLADLDTPGSQSSHISNGSAATSST